MYDFTLLCPSTLAEAEKALEAEDAQLLSGGQTLVPTLKQRLAAPSLLVSTSNLEELKGITLTEDHIRIGAATPHAEVARQVKQYPALAKLAGGIGDPAVRNRGTIGGSLANNDPSACYPAAVLASGANIITNRREILADDFFQGLFTTALEEGEIVVAVEFPVPSQASYVKFDQSASRFALVGVFVAKFASDVRLAVTGAGDEGVFRWSEAEAALSSSFSPDALEELTVSPSGIMGDLFGTRDYRAHLVGVLAKRAVAIA